MGERKSGVKGDFPRWQISVECRATYPGEKKKKMGM